MIIVIIYLFLHLILKKTMFSMSCKAALNTIENLNGLKKDQITDIIFVTMTSTIEVPSIDIFISKQFGLNSNIKHLNVESMECLKGVSFS